MLEGYGPLEEVDGYPFLEKDSKKNIIFDIDEASMVDGSSMPQIKAATLEKLVEKITSEDRPNNELVHIFLMTYPTFTTAEELLNLLIARYPFSLFSSPLSPPPKFSMLILAQKGSTCQLLWNRPRKRNSEKRSSYLYD